MRAGFRRRQGYGGQAVCSKLRSGLISSNQIARRFTEIETAALAIPALRAAFRTLLRK
jgi:hypothetical protein